MLKIAMVAALLSGLGPFAAAAQQDAYPNRMIRYVVPFPAGATSDSVGRIIAHRLSEVLGQTIVVENKPGAGTALAAEMVARAEPDGYTLFNVTNATLAAIPHLMKLGYDAETAFTPVALTGDLYSYLAVNPDLPVADFAQFVAYATANPGKLSIGSAGNGSLGHLYGRAPEAENRNRHSPCALPRQRGGDSRRGCRTASGHRRSGHAAIHPSGSTARACDFERAALADLAGACDD